MQVAAADGAARAGSLLTPRGEVATPCFMPVGSRGVVRLLSAADLDTLAPQVVLANTYHLMLRPGADVVATMGGLHAFTGWSGHYLTDSGGYQVMSLPCQVDDGGVTFRSSYDGSWHRLTPESAVATQQLLGADIQMVLDVCTELPAARDALVAAGERTLDWAARAREAHQGPDQMLFGIVQGGAELDLRAAYARRLVRLGFDGYALGGLSVGEPPGEMLAALAAAVAELPTGAPRYLMGVGDPWSVVAGIGLGVDMFDCVLPTRLARHGTALTGSGKLAVKAGRYASDAQPIDPGCPCPVCARHSRAYLRHLFNVAEPSAGRLVSLHNLHWLLRLVSEARQAVLDGRFAEFQREVQRTWAATPLPGTPLSGTPLSGTPLSGGTCEPLG
ncbi:MAG TPA: tRNA guanosine(34) transglycosylase Tgt [Acidimicrobiales bacterium]|nr:tRNA guanosine(34) transglycosylase Tgt [Acidimicrobiales bacterium]